MKQSTVIISILLSSLVFLLFYSTEYLRSDTHVPVLFSGYSVIWIVSKTRTGLFNMTVIFSLISGLYSLYFITYLSEKKTMKILKYRQFHFQLKMIRMLNIFCLICGRDITAIPFSGE